MLWPTGSVQGAFDPRPTLAFPVGRRPGFDPTHPACVAFNSNFLSVAAIPNGILNLTKAAVPVISSGTQVMGIDGRIGPVTINAPEYDLPGGTTNPAGGVTMAAIFYVSASTFAGVILGMNQGNTGGYRIDNGPDALHFTFTMPNVVAITGPSISLNTPYFGVASGVGGGSIYFLVRNLMTGGIVTSSTTTASSPNPAGGFVFGTLAGRQSSILGGIAAACCIPKQLTPAQMFAWAADPWSFWYPSTFPSPIMSLNMARQRLPVLPPPTGGYFETVYEM